VKAFARVEEVSDQAGLPQIEEPIGPTMEYETPYHEDGENEYVP
jgi:hypothetical protein